MRVGRAELAIRVPAAHVVGLKARAMGCVRLNKWWLCAPRRPRLSARCAYHFLNAPARGPNTIETSNPRIERELHATPSQVGLPAELKHINKRRKRNLQGFP